jgi:ADP-ribosylglycohydrolase
MLCLLESIEKCSGFNLKFFSEKWQELFQDYDGYYDKATKQTLNNLQKQKEPENAGSSSTDLAGASRLAPLFYVYSDNYEMLIKSCREQTAMTHNHPQVTGAAEFFGHIVWHILRDTRPTAAIKLAIEEKFSEGEIAFWAEEGLSSKDRETRSTIFNFGQMCDIKGAFPSVIHLIARYEDDLETALIENVMAGGDSAARGLITGAVLGAHLGLDAIPEKWLNGLKCKKNVERLLENLYQENMA